MFWGFCFAGFFPQGCLLDSDEHFHFAIRGYSSFCYFLSSLLEYKRKMKGQRDSNTKPNLISKFMLYFH